MTSLGETPYNIRLKLVRCSTLTELMHCPESRLELQQILNVVVKSYLQRKGYEDVGVN
jgi:hypothetical protein